MLCFSVLFFFKQKTAYEMRISDWSSDVCSSDLITDHGHEQHALHAPSKPLILTEIMLVEKSFHRIDPGLAWLELPCAKIVEDKAIERPKPDFGFTIDIGGDRQQVGFNLRPNAHFVKKLVSRELDQDHCIPQLTEQTNEKAELSDAPVLPD